MNFVQVKDKRINLDCVASYHPEEWNDGGKTCYSLVFTLNASSGASISNIITINYGADQGDRDVMIQWLDAKTL